MKQGLIITACKKPIQQLLFALVFFTALLVSGRLTAQTDSTKTTEDTVAVETESSLISPAVAFSSIQKADSSIDLKAVMQAKIKGSFMKLPLLKVRFVQIIDDAENELGFGITDKRGTVIFNCKASTLTTDKEGKLHLKAIFSGNKSMDPVEEELTIKKARLEITPLKEDSLLTIKVKLVESGTEKPVPEVVIGIFVKRMFLPVKIGEGTTDENGEASVEISDKLPGDAAGNITLLARLDENEIFGNLESSVSQKWGVAVSDKLKELPRGLWSPHPPIWMLVTFIILMTTVWGHYVVIIYELFRLRKEEPHPPVNANVT